MAIVKIPHCAEGNVESAQLAWGQEQSQDWSPDVDSALIHSNVWFVPATAAVNISKAQILGLCCRVKEPV